VSGPISSLDFDSVFIGPDSNGLSSNFKTCIETSSDIEKSPVARAALGPDIVAATAPGSGPPPSPPASVIGEIESAREREFLNRLTRCQYSDTHARRWSCRPPPVRASASAVLPVSPLHARRGTREEGRERGFEPSAQARLLIRLFHRNANVCRNVPADSDKCRGMRRMRRQHRREENLC